MWTVIKRFVLDAAFALALLGAAGSTTLGEIDGPPIWLKVAVPIVILAGGLYKKNGESSSS